ncbi:MAG: hypothetical protein P4L31_06650 [Candidatus Babeliales bacterium]|nr:hypothetical protein [Candidatus Babeliales bacterium]
MKLIKITHLSLALIYSCSLLASAPAPARAAAPQEETSDDGLEFGISMTPIAWTKESLKNRKAALEDFIEKSQNKDQLQKVHQSFCTLSKLSTHVINAEQYLNDLKQQGAASEQIETHRNQFQILEKAFGEENNKYTDCCHQCNGDSQKMWGLFGITEYRAFILRDYARLLRSEKEQLLQEKRVIQNQVKQQSTQIQQLLAHNQSLQAALQQQQEPGAQQIEGAPNQMPAEPGAI